MAAAVNKHDSISSFDQRRNLIAPVATVAKAAVQQSEQDLAGDLRGLEAAGYKIAQ